MLLKPSAARFLRRSRGCPARSRLRTEPGNTPAAGVDYEFCTSVGGTVNATGSSIARRNARAGPPADYASASPGLSSIPMTVGTFTLT